MNKLANKCLEEKIRLLLTTLVQSLEHSGIRCQYNIQDRKLETNLRNKKIVARLHIDDSKSDGYDYFVCASIGEGTMISASVAQSSIEQYIKGLFFVLKEDLDIAVFNESAK